MSIAIETKHEKRSLDCVTDIHLHPAWCKISHVTDNTTADKMRYALAYLIGDQVHMGAPLDCAYGVDKADLQKMT